MQIQFVDSVEPANNTTLSEGDAEQLRQILHRLRMAEAARICILHHENGFDLTFGVGDQAAGVQFASSDGMPPYLVAINDGSVTGDHAFYFDTSYTEFAERHCISFDNLLLVVVHFLEAGGRTELVLWEEI